MKKENKNQTEKERKDEIKALNKESAFLVMGQESETIPLEEITKARLTRACLSEIPPSIVQFYTDGKSPKDRPMSNVILCFFLLINLPDFIDAICRLLRRASSTIGRTLATVL